MRKLPAARASAAAASASCTGTYSAAAMMEDPSDTEVLIVEAERIGRVQLDRRIEMAEFDMLAHDVLALFLWGF